MADRSDTAVENITVDTPPIEGLSYTLKCGITAAGKPEEILQYAWQRDGKDIPGENEQNLIIDELKRGEGVLYRCAAENRPGMLKFGNPLHIAVWCKCKNFNAGINYRDL